MPKNSSKWLSEFGVLDNQHGYSSLRARASILCDVITGVIIHADFGNINTGERIMARKHLDYFAIGHIIRKGWKYLIRIKDINSNGISSSLTLPNSDVFDVDYTLFLTRRRTKETQSDKRKYKFLASHQKFEELLKGSKGIYEFSFRILRFPISETTYEVIITNLDRDSFSLENIKKLYHMRWGIIPISA